MTKSTYLTTEQALSEALKILASFNINQFLTEDNKQTRHDILQAFNRLRVENKALYGTIESMKQTNAALIKKLQPDHIADVSNMVSCDICGDYHELDNVPFGCQTGGEE